MLNGVIALALLSPALPSAEELSHAGEETPTTSPSTSTLGFAVSFGFAPRFGSFTDLDDELQDYGFAPVAKPYLLTYGLRARVYAPRGVIFGGTMNYAFARSDAPGNPVPTTTSRIEVLARAGHQLGYNFEASLNLGFGVHSHSLGSERQGGALVYMGPVLQPQLGYTLPITPSFVHVSLGYSLLVPLGAAHDQPLWEADFRRPVIHSFMLGVESGFGFNRRRLRWRQRGSRR